MDSTLAQSQDQTRIASHSGSRLFIIGFILPCIVALLLVGFSLAVLFSNRENIGPVEAARIQHQAQGGLYGSSIVYRPYPYKMELYRLTNPDVAIVGSSRAMPFLAAGFSASEANLGGAVRDMATGERMVAEILPIHRPKLVLFALDYWWFNPARIDDGTEEVETGAEIDFTLDDLIAPYRWMGAGVRLSNLLHTMRERADPPLIGALANQNESGFDVGGAYHYGDTHVQSGDRKFKSTLRLLRDGGKLSANTEFSEEAWQGLQHIDRMLREDGVEVRYIMPPVASVSYARMKENGIGLITALQDHLASSGMRFYDFTDPATLGSPDCEFVDGRHGGHVTYLRILRAMQPDIESVPATRGLIKPVAELDRLITANSGRTTLHDEPGPPEVDFLQIGCNKS